MGRKNRTIQVGDVVNVNESDGMGNDGKLGKMLAHHTSMDGLVRSVQILVGTSSGKSVTLRRPAARLVIIVVVQYTCAYELHSVI